MAWIILVFVFNKIKHSKKDTWKGRAYNRCLELFCCRLVVSQAGGGGGAVKDREREGKSWVWPEYPQSGGEGADGDGGGESGQEKETVRWHGVGVIKRPHENRLNQHIVDGVPLELLY